MVMNEWLLIENTMLKLDRLKSICTQLENKYRENVEKLISKQQNKMHKMSIY